MFSSWSVFGIFAKNIAYIHRRNFNFWLGGTEYIKGKQTIAI